MHMRVKTYRSTLLLLLLLLLGKSLELRRALQTFLHCYPLGLPAILRTLAVQLLLLRPLLTAQHNMMRWHNDVQRHA